MAARAVALGQEFRDKGVCLASLADWFADQIFSQVNIWQELPPIPSVDH
jgi:hypothetical protein